MPLSLRFNRFILYMKLIFPIAFIVQSHLSNSSTLCKKKYFFDSDDLKTKNNDHLTFNYFDHLPIVIVDLISEYTADTYSEAHKKLNYFSYLTQTKKRLLQSNISYFFNKKKAIIIDDTNFLAAIYSLFYISQFTTSFHQPIIIRLSKIKLIRLWLKYWNKIFHSNINLYIVQLELKDISLRGFKKQEKINFSKNLIFLINHFKNLQMIHFKDFWIYPSH